MLRLPAALALLLAPCAAVCTVVAGPTAHFGSFESTVVPSGQATNHNVAVDANFNVYVPDTWNHRVLKETWTGSGYVQSTIGTGWMEP